MQLHQRVSNGKWVRHAKLCGVKMEGIILEYKLEIILFVKSVCHGTIDCHLLESGLRTRILYS